MAAPRSSVQLIPIRSTPELTPSRLARGAEAGFGAFDPDPVFRWLRPNPTPDHAERLRLYFEDRLRNVVIKQGKDLVVLAVRKDVEGQHETVLGWAIWERTLGEAEKQTGKQDYGWGIGM
jgi:hypothetical protein